MQLRELMLRDASQTLEDGKEYFIESRLAPLARTLDMTIGSLIEATRRDRQLATRVVEAMCIHETSWYRDAPAFAAVKQVLTDIAATRGNKGPLNIWSAACSTGQEPFTIAMLCAEHPQLRQMNVRITATDISNHAINRATAGEFSQLEIGRGLPASALVRWFSRSGASWVANSDLRSMVSFRQMNLGAMPYPYLGGPFDLVLLRNVLIYFPVAEKTKVLAAVESQLVKDGVLLLGASETTVSISDRFKPDRVSNVSVFRRAI
jgi:chemotaxis protein methyltransferase CheR